MSAPAPAAALSPQQLECIQRILQGEPLAVMGPAGTGKSCVLRDTTAAFHKQGKQMIRNAPTGQTASDIDGCTIHSAFCLGTQSEATPELLKTLRSPRYVALRDRVVAADVWIVDEISMVSGELFALVDAICRMFRKSDEPFGGLQVVVFGDFFQLPPVKCKTLVFETELWNTVFPRPQVVELTTIYRQSDPVFTDMLMDIRMGTVSATSMQTIEACKRPLPVLHGIEPTRIFARRMETHQYNVERLLKLEGQGYSFKARDTLIACDLERLNKAVVAPEVLHIKVGCQLMLIKNIDVASQRFNGSRCVCVAVYPERRSIRVCYLDGVEATVPEMEIEVRGPNGKLLAVRVQLPFILAYANTIHKTQGTTLDYVVVDTSDCFEAGHVYVALSRVRTLKGLEITAFDPRKVRTDPRVIDYMRSLAPVVVVSRYFQ